MSSDRIIPLVSLIVAILAVLPMASSFEYWALILLVLGLVFGFLHTETDMVKQMVYVLAAMALPVIANNLNEIPFAGGYLNSVIDNFAVAIAGVAIANFIMDLKNRIMPAGGGSSM